VPPPWESVWRLLKKLKAELLYDPAIPAHIPQGIKVSISRDTYTPVFITAQVTVAKAWNQCRSPMMDEWIKKMYIQWSIIQP
jgi:hypothetical protein